MNFLIDTNILIALEPLAPEDMDARTEMGMQFSRLALQSKSTIFVHPAALQDIERDSNEVRRTMRRAQCTRYPALPSPPKISPDLAEVIGSPPEGSNNWVDNHFVAALAKDAVDYVVTEDLGIKKKAARVDRGERVATLSEAVAILSSLFSSIPFPPPAVSSLTAHEIDENDRIFASFRRDYRDFDAWLRKCKRGHRKAWSITRGEAYAAICIIKEEEPNEVPARLQLDGKVVKICSFKVADEYTGFRYGELLLKTVFQYAKANHVEWLYVTVFDKYDLLIELFEDFGFRIEPSQKTSSGELMMTKPTSLMRDKESYADPYDLHVRFGPSCARFTGVDTFIVPIQARYHRLLFPELEQQGDMFSGNHVFGNAIRKAYLCNAPIRTIRKGANLLFYRSGDAKSIGVTGVVEGTQVSCSPDEIARYVGKRTVYDYVMISSLCESDVLAILFRQAYTIRRPLSLDALRASGILKSAPQSIMRVPEEKTAWIQERLGM